jgi:hypothetical protein
VQQQLELLLAADERGQRGPAQRLEPAQNAAFADHAPGALRFDEAGELPRPEILDLEERADLPPRALGHDERIRCSERLKPCGEVRRLANDPPLLRRARADQIADDSEAGRDADAQPQPLRRLQ